MPIPENGLGSAIDKVIEEHAGVKKNNENIRPEIIEEKIDAEPQKNDVVEDDLDKPLNINELLGYKPVIIEEPKEKEPDAYDAEKMQTALSDVNMFLSTLYYHYDAVHDMANKDLMAEASAYCHYLKDKAKGKGEVDAEKEKYRQSFDKAVSFLTGTNENNETGLTQIMNSALSASYPRGERNRTVPPDADVQAPDNSVRAIRERRVGYSELSNRTVSRSEPSSTVDYVKQAGKFVEGLRTLSEITKTDMKPEITALERSANAQKKKLIDYKCDCILASVKGIETSERWRRNSNEYQTMLDSVLDMRRELKRFKEVCGMEQDTPEKQKMMKELAGTLKSSMKTVRRAAKNYIREKNGGNRDWTPKTDEGKKRYDLAKSMEKMTDDFIGKELDPLTAQVRAEVRAVKRQEPPKKKRPTRDEDEEMRFTEALKNLAEPAEYRVYSADRKMTPNEKREIVRDAAANIIAANIIHDMHEKDSEGKKDALDSTRRYSRDAIGFVSKFVKRCECFKNLPDYAEQDSVSSISDIIYDASNGAKMEEALLDQVKNEMGSFRELQQNDMQNQVRKVLTPPRPEVKPQHRKP